MTENVIANSLGRKTFFLHPPALVINQVIPELIQQEFEAYVVKDEGKLKRVLTKYPDSIVFAGINEGMKIAEWEKWIRGITTNSEIRGLDIGIIASINDDELQSKCAAQFRLACGYTVMKSDSGALIKQLVNILNNMNAKGRRKYIRVLTDEEQNTTINLPMNGTFINGTIKDISVVGFSCTFTEDPGLTKNGLFGDIQIRLQSHLLKVEGIVFGSRVEKSEKIYVILFTQRIDPEIRTKIRKYIQTNLQSKMDDELG